MAAMHTIEAPQPNAVESALLRGLEEQNNELQTHVAWLSAQLAQVSADEAAARDSLAVLTSRFDPSSALTVREVQQLQARIAELSIAVATQHARAHAADADCAQLRSALAKREDQVMQLSIQLGQAAAHIKAHANAVQGWSELHPVAVQPLSSDFTVAKFEMQQRLITNLTQQLAEATLEVEGCRRAAQVWEARHMMWEQTVENPRWNAGSAATRQVSDAADEANQRTSSEPAERSLLDAERAWRERCEQQRRREVGS